MKKLFKYRGESAFSYYFRVLGDFLVDLVIWMTMLGLVLFIYGAILEAI